MGRVGIMDVSVSSDYDWSTASQEPGDKRSDPYAGASAPPPDISSPLPDVSPPSYAQASRVFTYRPEWEEIRSVTETYCCCLSKPKYSPETIEEFSDCEINQMLLMHDWSDLTKCELISKAALLRKIAQDPRLLSGDTYQAPIENFFEGVDYRLFRIQTFYDTCEELSYAEIIGLYPNALRDGLVRSADPFMQRKFAEAVDGLSFSDLLKDYGFIPFRNGWVGERLFYDLSSQAVNYLRSRHFLKRWNEHGENLVQFGLIEESLGASIHRLVAPYHHFQMDHEEAMVGLEEELKAVKTQHAKMLEETCGEESIDSLKRKMQRDINAINRDLDAASGKEVFDRLFISLGVEHKKALKRAAQSRDESIRRFKSSFDSTRRKAESQYSQAISAAKKLLQRSLQPPQRSAEALTSQIREAKQEIQRLSEVGRGGILGAVQEGANMPFQLAGAATSIISQDIGKAFKGIGSTIFGEAPSVSRERAEQLIADQRRILQNLTSQLAQAEAQLSQVTLEAQERYHQRETEALQALNEVIHRIDESVRQKQHSAEEEYNLAAEELNANFKSAKAQAVTDYEMVRLPLEQKANVRITHLRESCQSQIFDIRAKQQNKRERAEALYLESIERIRDLKLEAEATFKVESKKFRAKMTRDVEKLLSVADENSYSY